MNSLEGAGEDHTSTTLSGVDRDLCPAQPVSPGDGSSDAIVPADDAEEEEVEWPEPAEEAASAPVLRDPGEPTLAETQEHNLTHAAFRSWCPHCVRGRARHAPHRRTERDADSVPVISFDYGFLGSDPTATEAIQEAAGFSPILVMHDEISGSIFAHAVPHKGVDYADVHLAVRAVCRDINHLGYKRIIITDDQEPGLVAFL